MDIDGLCENDDFQLNSGRGNLNDALNLLTNVGFKSRNLRSINIGFGNVNLGTITLIQITYNL